MKRSIGFAAVVLGVMAVPGLAYSDDAPAPAAAAAPAGPWTFTSNVTLATEYIYRGIGQTNRHPAIQGGFDLGHESGFYVGNWNSNISWISDANTSASAPIEMDFYGGYKGEITKEFTYDVGYLEYYYPGNYPGGFVSPNTGEVYGNLIYGPFSGKYSYSTTNLFGAVAPDGRNTHGSGYLDFTYTQDLGDGLTLGAHVGHQSVAHFGAASYTDYKISIGKDFSGYVVTAAIVGTNAEGDPGQFYHNAFGKDLGKTRVVLSVGKTF